MTSDLHSHRPEEVEDEVPASGVSNWDALEKSFATLSIMMNQLEEVHAEQKQAAKVKEMPEDLEGGFDEDAMVARVVEPLEQVISLWPKDRSKAPLIGCLRFYATLLESPLFEKVASHSRVPYQSRRSL